MNVPNHAVVVDPAVPGRLTIKPVDPPAPLRSEAIVRVAAISLNRGEIRRAMTADAGWRPGWDFAGTVEQAAADGSGPRPGARVVGLLDSGAWAEYVAVPTLSLAELPASVSFAQAATLPIAGLTALYALDRGGNLLGRKVLITGASGGVGHLACQLAREAGAYVVGVVRQEKHAAAVKEARAHEVVVSEGAAEAAAYGPFHLILESVGGKALGEALGLLASGGTCVSFGTSAGGTVTFDATRFYSATSVTLYGLRVFQEFRHEGAGVGLSRLVRLVAEGRLRPLIEVEAPWTEVGSVAQRLIDRGFAGKAVLHVTKGEA